MRGAISAIAALAVVLAAGCASMPNNDPLTISVANIEPLPGEGIELRLAVTVRIQNPNDAAIDYSGAALSLELNGKNLANGVSAAAGTVPRYGETTINVPVTISAFDMVRQALGFMGNAEAQREVQYRVRGKLEGGLFGTRRFTDEGTLELPTGAQPPVREL